MDSDGRFSLPDFPTFGEQTVTSAVEMSPQNSEAVLPAVTTPHHSEAGIPAVEIGHSEVLPPAAPAKSKLSLRRGRKSVAATGVCVYKYRYSLSIVFYITWQKRRLILNLYL